VALLCAVCESAAASVLWRETLKPAAASRLEAGLGALMAPVGKSYWSTQGTTLLTSIGSFFFFGVSVDFVLSSSSPVMGLVPPVYGLDIPGDGPALSAADICAFDSNDLAEE